MKTKATALRSATLDDLDAITNHQPAARNWLLNLPAWDGTPRVDHWLVSFAGVKHRVPADGMVLSSADQAHNTYINRVARYFLIGMVARAMKPGCKFDYCLVLAGKQGLGKSTALSILGGEWYSDFDLDLTDKSAMSALCGKWLHEFAEMGSVTRAESSELKSFLSLQVDEYRPAYGKREIKSPRQLVFAGSVNQWQWLGDAAGARRFWPVTCECAVNTVFLRGVREQLFAEALALYRQGERYWPTPDEQRTLFDPEQLPPGQFGNGPDQAIGSDEDLGYVLGPLAGALVRWVNHQPKQTAFNLDDAQNAVGIPLAKQTRDMTTRVGIALRKMGCTRIEYGTYLPPGGDPRQTITFKSLYAARAPLSPRQAPPQACQQPDLQKHCLHEGLQCDLSGPAQADPRLPAQQSPQQRSAGFQTLLRAAVRVATRFGWRRP